MGTCARLAWAPVAYSTTVLVKSLATQRSPDWSRAQPAGLFRLPELSDEMVRSGPLGPPEKALLAYSTTERPL